MRDLKSDNPTLAELFELLDNLGITRYQKYMAPTLPEYQGQDWRSLTINGKASTYHSTGEPLIGNE